MKLVERLDTVDLPYWIGRAVEGHGQWTSTFAPYARHPSLEVSDDRFGTVFENYEKLLHGNYPFFHPRYIGQMLKPPHEAAVVAYLSAMLINPNNHSSDGGPVTDRMEREVIDQLATMFGFDGHLGHLTSSGTMANLEALYVARCLHPDRGVAYSSASHYTHERMTRLLGMDSYAVPADRYGRMDLDALEDLLRTGKVGTVVLTLGTTGVGAIDPLAEAMVLRERYDVRFHVDAAYGGFYSVLAGTHGLDPAPWAAIRDCDSVVVDPHKQGLQPYGCGSVIFADPAVAKFYVHDSPYTYFTPADLHLGEISLECSRAGAAAAALWFTFQLLPPTADGLGEVLAANRRAALRLAGLMAESDRLQLHQEPDLDIVTYFPRLAGASLSGIDRECAAMLEAGMHDGADPVFLSLMRIERDAFAELHPAVRPDAKATRILRSVLMKPESETYVDELHQRLERLSASQWKEG